MYPVTLGKILEKSLGVRCQYYIVMGEHNTTN